MLTSLTFTISQTGMRNFYCHYPRWYLRWQESVCSTYLRMIFHFDSSERNNNLPWSPRIYIGNRSAADSSSGGWIRIVADSIRQLTRVPVTGYELRLSRVLAAGYKWRLTPSYCWLEFRWLDKSCGWFYPVADSSSSNWIRLKANFILRLTMTRVLTRVSAARYELQRIPYCGWLRVTADSSSGWSRLMTVLNFDI